jgi:hypothetical protein
MLLGRGSKLPQKKAQASLRTPKRRPWSAVACYRLGLAKLASPAIVQRFGCHSARFLYLLVPRDVDRDIHHVPSPATYYSGRAMPPVV